MNQSVLRTIFYEMIVPIMLRKDAQKLQSKNRRTLMLVDKKTRAKVCACPPADYFPGHTLRVYNLVLAVWQREVANFILSDLQMEENGQCAWVIQGSRRFGKSYFLILLIYALNGKRPIVCVCSDLTRFKQDVKNVFFGAASPPVGFKCVRPDEFEKVQVTRKTVLLIDEIMSHNPIIRAVYSYHKGPIVATSDSDEAQRFGTKRIKVFNI